jgi:dihydroorotase
MKKTSVFWDHMSTQERLEAIQQTPSTITPYHITIVLDERLWGGLLFLLFLSLGAVW